MQSALRTITGLVWLAVGSVDEITIFDRALSAAERAML